MTRLTINGKPVNPIDPLPEDRQWRKLGAAILGFSAVIVLVAAVLLAYWVML